MTQHTNDQFTVAVLQCPLAGSRKENLDIIEGLVRQAAHDGAQIILPPELFAGPYFPQTQKESYFDWAQPLEAHPLVGRFSEVAQELEAVIPVSFFERENNAYYNSVAVLDADGSLAGVYRKSHIPTGPGYEEKFYFHPGNTGFMAVNTRYARIGVGICWDQWFPEAARSMVLDGAEVLLYPTAIGSEPEEPDLDTRQPWRRAMVGHAVCNTVPVAAANRVGEEGNLCFFGTSFIASERGDIVSELDAQETGFVAGTFSRAELHGARASFGLFRDRRPELYHRLTKL